MNPFISLTGKISNPVWLHPNRLLFSSETFAGKVDVHPVIVRETMYRLPFSLIPQVAFVGRSNVGKSSLINAMVHGREIARPSPLPGRTRQLFTFDIADRISLVDLPGYGFAGKISKSDRDSWYEMIKEYISHANGLERIVSLVDCRHGPKAIDEEFWKVIEESPIHSKRKNKAQLVVVLTKVDLITPEALRVIAKTTLAVMNKHKSFVWPYLHLVSSQTGFGVKELRCAISSMCPVPPYIVIVSLYCNTKCMWYSRKS